MLAYPAAFVRAVKKSYPGWVQLHTALDAGSPMVGRFLDDSRVRFTPSDILAATSFEDLQAEAKRAQDREKLYIRWCKLYREAQEQKGA